MNAADKRRAQRFAMALPVAVKTVDKGGEEKSVETIDISSTGVYFELGVPMDIGSAMEFVLTLPAEITQGKPVRVKCRGKVVRVDKGNRPNSVGVAATIERYEFVRDS